MGHRLIKIVAAGALALALQPLRPSLTAAASPCQVEGVERIVAVGDVHGAFDRFVEILQTAGIVDERLRWAGGGTYFIQTGDVLDRGPDSLKVLDLLRRLEEEAPRAGGASFLLLGNHEVMRLLGDLRYAAPGEYQAFVTPKSERNRREYMRSRNGTDRDQPLEATPLGLFEMRVAFGREGPYGAWLRKLNAVVKINGMLFLHGGISPAFAGTSCDAINATLRREITTDIDKTRTSPRQSLSARSDGPLWYRGLAQEPDGFAPVVADILARQHARAMVIGHTVSSSGRIHDRFDGRVFQIDTGMQQEYQPGGRASALEIRDGVFTAIYQDRRDVILPGAVDETAVIPIRR